VNWDVFAAVIGTALGGGTLLWSAWNAFLALKSRRWPQVEGTIVVSDLERSRDIDSGYMYRPEISYRYTVADEDFVGSRARFGDALSLSWSAPAVRIVQRYKVNSRVRVRYDPDNPHESVLEPGMNGMVIFGAVAGALTLVVGILSLRGNW
jgi:hypothetical protein